ncbi:MAG: uroporphyrinogen decarboxylase family protein [Clostridia bacterium]
MKTFEPDYNHLLSAAKNITPERIPIYEHLISTGKMEEILATPFASLYHGTLSEIAEYFRQYCRFFREMTYDTVSFECIVTEVMPGNGALYANKDGCIKNYDDFSRYPWDGLKDLYFTRNVKYFDALAACLPRGMKAVGGIGNGILECVQDVVGYINLCYIKADDPELYGMLFEKMGQVLCSIWEEFIRRYSDAFCVMRFGDDLGYKSQTLLSREDTISLIIPQYRKIISLVHAANKPFLLHSCGNLFPVMDALIDAGIDAKHSNEDEIAPMAVWYEKYSRRIGNFGGIDADVLCRRNKGEIQEYVQAVYNLARRHGGVALGSGNSIPDYIPTKNYLTMIETINRNRFKEES